MPNEFIIKNGFRSQGNSEVTGSLIVTAGVTGSFTGSFVGSGAGLTGVSAFPFTGSALITGSLGVTGSFTVSSSIGNLISVSSSQIILNGPGGTAFTPSIALRRNGSNVLVIDEYAAKFTGDVYTDSIRANSTNPLYFQAQSGPGGVIVMRPDIATLSIGYYSTASRLDVRAQGSGSSDINFRVRDNADAYNVLDLQGNAVLNLRVNNTTTAPASGSNVLGTNIDTVVNARGINTSGTMVAGFQGIITNSGASVGLYADGGGKIVSSTAGILQHNSGAGNGRMNFVSGTNTTGWSFLWNTAPTFGIGNTVFSIYPTNAQGGGGTLALGTTLGTTVADLPAAAFGKNTFFIANGTAPTTSSTDSFALYSADRGGTAGRASAHFRSEDGTINVLGDLSGIGTSSPGARLDVRAQGSGSSDIAFRVRNSADNQNTVEANGAGGFYVRRNTGNTLMSLDPDGKLAIGYNANVTNHQNSDLSIGYNAAIGAGAGGQRIAIGQGATTSLYYGAAIGLGASVNSNGGLALGCGTSTTGGDIVNPQTAIGMGVGTSAPYSIMIGNVYSLSAAAINNIANSFMLHLGGSGNGNYQNFFVNSNSNIVLRRGTQLTSSAHFDTTATNTLTLHSGSIPATTISGAFQFYAATGSISNNVRPHFHTGNGTVVWLGDESRLFNITASNISASNITASSLTVPSGSVTITTGSVTMPNRPAFSVYGAGTTNNLTTTQNGDGTLNSNNYATIYYQGTGFDASTGIFTAPIAGLYQVDVIGRNSGFAGGISQLAVVRNNSNGAGEVLMIEWAASSTMNHAGGSKIYRLAVGDTLRLKVLAGEINFDGNDNWSVAYIG